MATPTPTDFDREGELIGHEGIKPVQLLRALVGDGADAQERLRLGLGAQPGDAEGGKSRRLLNQGGQGSQHSARGEDANNGSATGAAAGQESHQRRG